MELKKGYKETEVGTIPNDWNVKTIADISNPVRGGSPRPAGDSKYFNGDFIPWLTVASLTNIPISQIYVNETDGFLTELGSTHSRILEKETLIIANSGATLGVAKLLGVKCCANDGIAALLDFDKNTDKFYVVSFINSKIKYLREVVATGNGQPNLNTELIGNLKIPLPPTKSEQTAIATALSDVDALINSLEKLIEKKRNIKQGVMQELLKPKKGWVEEKLTDVVDYIHGKAHEQDIVEDGPFTVVNSKFVSTEGAVAKYSNSNFCPARKNDLLTVLSDLPNGKALAKCFFVDKDNKYAVNQRVCIWRTKGSDPRFLFYVLNRNKYFLAINDGVSQTHILNHHIEKCKIFVPIDVDEQNEIATILLDMDIEITSLETKLTKAKQIKQGMMQELLTGKIRLV
jgi:type I restriction enzyme S subunit